MSAPTGSVYLRCRCRLADGRACPKRKKPGHGTWSLRSNCRKTARVIDAPGAAAATPTRRPRTLP